MVMCSVAGLVFCVTKPHWGPMDDGMSFRASCTVVIYSAFGTNITGSYGNGAAIT